MTAKLLRHHTCSSEQATSRLLRLIFAACLALMNAFLSHLQSRDLVHAAKVQGCVDYK